MFFLYNILMTFGITFSIPLSLWRGEKYTPGFRQRLGLLPEFKQDGRTVLWLHCNSVGEVQAARPIVERLLKRFPHSRLVISTTTKSGRKLAKILYADRAELVFYFPFDWNSCVRRALAKIKPNVILMMESDIWFNFIREAGKRGSRVFLLNGKLSEKSFNRYQHVSKMLRQVMHNVDEILLQSDEDAERFQRLGIRSCKIKVTGNIKFDSNLKEIEPAWTEYFQNRFAVSDDAPLIVAAGTHASEERLILEAFKKIWKNSPGRLPRLLLAPDDPKRCDEILDLIRETGFDWAQCSESISNRDKAAEVILLDGIGELREVLPLAEIVFVGGSLIPRGGQNVLEPAARRKAIVTGYYTTNFDEIVKEFVARDALVQLPGLKESKVPSKLAKVLQEILENPEKRERLADNSFVLTQENSGAVDKTFEFLQPYLHVQVRQFAE